MKTGSLEQIKAESPMNGCEEQERAVGILGKGLLTFSERTATVNKPTQGGLLQAGTVDAMKTRGCFALRAMSCISGHNTVQRSLCGHPGVREA